MIGRIGVALITLCISALTDAGPSRGAAQERAGPGTPSTAPDSAEVYRLEARRLFLAAGPLLLEQAPSAAIRDTLEAGQELSRRAAAIYERVGDERNLSRVLTNQGNGYALLEEWETARSYFRRAITHARRSGNQGAEGDALSGIAMSYLGEGKTALVIAYQDSARVAYERDGDEVRVGRIRNSLGEQ
jgi:hypothetical protein